MSTSNTKAGGGKSAATEDVASSTITALSHQSSDFSSQGTSSQENVLLCSESLVSLTPSEDSQGNLQPLSQGEIIPGTSIATKELQEKSDVQISGSSSGTKVTTPTTLAFTPEKNQQTVGSNGFHYSPGLLATSNLSQLAELAANKSAINQTPTNSAQSSIQQHMLGGQARFVIPSQGLPSGLFGTYTSGSMVQYHGFSPAPSSQVPSPFVKGSIIQLTTGDLKRVEDLTTEDFINSIKLYPEHKLDTSTVVKIEDGTDAAYVHITFTINSSKKQVTLNCPIEHPFFVYGQGWTSSRPDQSQSKYCLSCHLLKVGDVCIFLSPSSVGVSLSSGATSQVVAAPSVVMSVPIKSTASASSSSQSTSSVTVSCLPGMSTVPANISGVVATSPLPHGIPSVQQGNIPPSPQGKPGTPISREHSQAMQPAQITLYTADGKPLDPQHSETTTVPGGFSLPAPSYYQPLPGTIMTAVPPGQTFVQGTVMPQGSVGNGLLVAAVGFMPGRPPQFVQQGLLYGSPGVEMVPKPADTKTEEVPHKARTDTKAEMSQPDPKRAKTETEVK